MTFERTDLSTLIRQQSEAALRTGALQPIRTEQIVLYEQGLEFFVRWVSTLQRKDAERLARAHRSGAAANPFLPPDPDLLVCELGSRHLAVLNKFPVIDNHLLVVTRAFEAQTAPLTETDFTALADIMTPLGGLGFYNGGKTAGASQSHKHLQWIADPIGMTAFTATLSVDDSSSLATHPVFPWRHLFVRLSPKTWQRGTGTALLTAYRTACGALDIETTSDPMPPYNLLLTEDWLLLVPRTAERWEEISINALGFAGSLFVHTPEQIEDIRHKGPLGVLASTGFASSDTGGEK